MQGEDGEIIHDALKPVVIDIDEITPHPRNARHGDIGAISESLRIHGQYDPLKYQLSTGLILVGNHRWKAAKALGWKKIAAIPLDVDDEQAVKILLVDNRMSDLASYDTDALLELVKEYGVEGTGYDLDAMDEMIADVSEPLGEATVGDPVISYQLVFDDSQQQDRWFQFMRWLRSTYPDEETNAARLDAYVEGVLSEHDA